MAAGLMVRRPVDGKTIMMRSILIAAGAGMLAAALASYFLTAPAPQGRTATPAKPDNAASSIAETAAAWPICSTMAAMVETPDWAALDSDFAAGKRAIATADWEGAIKALTNASLRDARNADIQNYLGYTYRRLWQFDQAMHRYRRALILDPRHRSAHEHLGEVYLAKGDLASAKEQLAALEQICLIPCNEYDDLERAIAEYNKVTNR